MTDQDKDITKDIYSQFSKKELLKIAGELGMKTTGSETSRTLADVILDDLLENGVPEITEETSDSMFELLVTAEFIDEDGNLIEEPDEEKPAEVVEVQELEIPDWKCFTYADPRDPACNKCKLYDACWKKRIELRPQCFGKRYNAADPECQVCIEAPYCVKETENG